MAVYSSSISFLERKRFVILLQDIIAYIEAEDYTLFLFVGNIFYLVIPWGYFRGIFFEFVLFLIYSNNLISRLNY